MSYRDELRADRAAAAEQKRADQRLAFEQRREDAAFRAEQARQERAAQAAERDRRAAARRAQWAKAAAWCGQHVQELLFVPVILVPALLAWTAMSGYGDDLYGWIGRLLPAFSEGAMWAFEAAIVLARRKNPDAPVLHLQVGVWVFAAVAGAMNFAHGVSSHGVDAGIVMALVSVAGVLVHQLITVGPRRTRQQRADARIAREAHRRETAIRRAAVRHAVAELAEDGTARLVYRPGTVRLTRRLGRTRLVPVAVPGTTPADGASVGEELAEEITGWLATRPTDPAGTAQTRPATTTPEPDDERVRDGLARVRAAIRAGKLPADPSRRQVQQFLKVRTQIAGAVARALKDGGDGGTGGVRAGTR